MTLANWYTNWPETYRSLIWKEIEGRKCQRIMEIGGTTHRSTGTDDMPDHVENFTIADISPEELANVPKDRFDVLELDACGDVSGIDGRFDLIISKFCGEHMKDGHKFHRNMYDLLAPGGAAIHMIPTLFASPFVINTIVPEVLSRNVIRLIQPQRFEADTMGKFPAYYSLCRGSQPYMARALKPLGYADVEVHAFFGHHYYDKIPGLKQIEAGLAGLCARRKWDFYSSYAIIVARK